MGSSMRVLVVHKRTQVVLTVAVPICFFLEHMQQDRSLVFSPDVKLSLVQVTVSQQPDLQPNGRLSS
eukprot:4242725-Amphidinium_carterae.1